DGSIGLRAVVWVLEGAARVLDRVHRHGVAHRNLHPSNVLVAQDGTPKLIGFGYAGWLAGSDAALAGSPGVAADVDIRPIGQMLSWVCSALRKPIPASLKAICDCCSPQGPREIFMDAADLAEKLHDCLAVGRLPPET